MEVKFKMATGSHNIEIQNVYESDCVCPCVKLILTIILSKI